MHLLDSLEPSTSQDQTDLPALDSNLLLDVVFNLPLDVVFNLPLDVVFVDADVQDSKILIEGLRGSKGDQTQWVIVELAPDQDGVEQISRMLSKLSSVDAVQILSHGDGSGIQLGNT